jgi:hypothetical protein
MFYIYNYLFFYIDNNVNNISFVRSYCLFLALNCSKIFTLACARAKILLHRPKKNNMPSKTHVIPLLKLKRLNCLTVLCLVDKEFISVLSNPIQNRSKAVEADSHIRLKEN